MPSLRGLMRMALGNGTARVCLGRGEPLTLLFLLPSREAPRGALSAPRRFPMLRSEAIDVLDP
jgi:hypothetical protein